MTEELEFALRRELHRQVVNHDGTRADEMIEIATRREPTVHRVNPASLAAAAVVLAIGVAAALLAGSRGDATSAAAGSSSAATSSALTSSALARPTDCTDTGSVRTCRVTMHWSCSVPVNVTGTPSPAATGTSRYIVDLPARIITVRGQDQSRLEADPPPYCRPGAGIVVYPAKRLPVTTYPIRSAASAPDGPSAGTNGTGSPALSSPVPASPTN